jgi:glycosyltransferase EpsD
MATIYKIDGVGVDLTRFHPVPEYEKTQLRKQFGYMDSDFILLYIAEFIPRKNHVFLLQQIPRLRQSILDLKVILAGKGVLLEECKKITEQMYITEVVRFLGYRNDIDVFCQIADIYCTPTKQEGLAVSNLEAMASGLPVVCSRIRGNTDAIIDGQNGFLFTLHNPAQMVNQIITLYNNTELRKTIAKNNIADIQKFSVDTAISSMARIYHQFMPEEKSNA